VKEIPVEFDYQGKQYKGYLSPVSGAAANVYTLNIDNYYRGQLSLVEDSLPGLPRDPENIKYKWRFTSQNGMFEDLTDYFADGVMAWYE